jgi:hypothetical protein
MARGSASPWRYSLLYSIGLNAIFGTLWFNIFKGTVGRMKRGRRCNTGHYRENEKAGETTG